MRLVMVVRGTRLGGVERHAAALMESLVQRGHAVAFAGPAQGWLGEHVRARGLPCLDLRMRGYVDLPSMLELARHARRFGADLLHGHSQRGAHYAGWAGRLARLPSVATAHSPRSRRFFGSAGQLIAVSQAVRDTLVAGGRPPARIEVVHNGVPDLLAQIGDPAATRRSFGLPADAFVGAIVARLTEQKGHDLALRVLAEHPELQRLHLIIAGRDNTAFGHAIKARAEALGLMPRLRFVGARSDVGALMAGVDFVFAPSRQEGFSLTLLEAASVGVPVVATSVDGNAEAVVDGETGLLAAAESVQELAAAIGRILQDDALRARLGRNARQAYERHYTVDAMLERTLAVYRKTLQQAAARSR